MVVGSAGAAGAAGFLCRPLMNLITTNSTKATMRKLMTELTNSPILDAGTAQADHDIREICLEEQADQRVDDVIHQSRDDGRERTADDHADCHIQHIAAHGKGLEFLKEFLDPLDLFFWHKNDRSFSNSPCVCGKFSLPLSYWICRHFARAAGQVRQGAKKAGPASAGPA